MKVQVVAPRKNLLYKALISQGLNTPAQNAPVCTKKFLLESKTGVTFIMQMAAIKKRACPNPPPMAVLNHLVVTNLKKMLLVPGKVAQKEIPGWNRLIMHLQARNADKDWCIETLATLHEFVPCDIFNPGYFYSRDAQRMRPIVSPEDLLFYGNLPERERMIAQSTLRPVISRTERQQ